jgi:hypothetical protein
VITTYHKHEISENYLDKWQQLIDEMTKQFDVSAGLLMRVWPEHFEVLVASRTEGNPYTPREKANLNTGLYCETVMATQSILQIPNALADEKWKNNPDLRFNMIMYMGMPLFWPDGNIFGTICILDNKIRRFNEIYQKLMWQSKIAIESDFKNIVSDLEK